MNPDVTRYKLIIRGLALATIFLSFSSAYLAVENYGLQQEYRPVTAQLATSTLVYQKLTADLRDRFLLASEQNSNLSSTLSQEQMKNIEFQAQINGLQGSVNLLKKLSETDKELLQKYSKVYFLNENYIPSLLVLVNPDYVYNREKPVEMHANVWPHLKDLMDIASTSGKVQLKILSGYRSFGTQATLKSDYRVSYGSGANAFSADQGYSEHQLGSTVDFTTPGLKGALNGFEKTDAYKWLIENAHKYGFVLSYPKNNSFYVFEPWHWRYVGIGLATRLYSEKKNFYDLDQREIDKYLALIFN
ncbi:MAG: hypothetical protein RIQ56_226 [Candidatus Parcubacteria bacterium]